jgi:hypothetical protein
MTDDQLIAAREKVNRMASAACRTAAPASRKPRSIFRAAA